MKSIATVIIAAILSAAALPSLSQNQASGLSRTASGLKETAPASGGGSGDVTAVNITTSSPLTGTASCASGTCAFTLGLGTVPATKGGTGASTYTLGDILYSSAANTLSKLAGNTTTTRKLLAQTGDGVDSAAPAWVPIYDIPCDTEEEECVFQVPTGFALGLNSDLLYLGIEDGTSRLGVTPEGVIVHEKLRLYDTAKEQRDITTLSSTGTILGTNVLCSTGGGAVVGTLDAATTTPGRFVYVTRSGASACTVAVESGHTLDGVTDGTASLADGASKTFKQTGDTAWATVSSWPIAAADLPTIAVNKGGTGATDASTARTNLGLAIGTDVQAYDADLAAVAGLSSAGLVARTGAGTATVRTLTAPAAGITVSNGDGVSGNPTLALADDLAGLEALGNGLPWRNTTWGVTTPTDGTVPYYTAAGGLLSTSITRESADITSLRNGTSAQEFKLFATYSGAGSNYEDFFIRTNSTTTWRIGTEKAGTGAARDIRFFPDGTDVLRISSTLIEPVVSIVPATSNTISLGQSSGLFRLLYHTYGQMGASSKALVDNTATAVWQVSVNNNSYEGGTLKYTVYATDGTDRQQRSGTVVFSALNNGGTETCAFGTPNDVANVTSGTLTVSWDCTTGTDVVLIRATADTSLASTTTFTCESRLDISSGNTTLTPQ